MKHKDISGLLDRYEQMLVSGKSMYFDADEYDELADYYEKLDDIETAKEIVRIGLKIHLDNESLMLRHARYLTYDGSYSAALHYMNSNFNGYDFEQYLLKIECLLQLGLYAEAHELTKEVVKDDETEPEILLSELGFLYVEAEYFDEAILYLEKSLDYDPDNLEVLGDLAYVYEIKQNFESSIQICERILDIDPYSFDAWLMLGKLHSLQDNYEKAIDAFDFALTLDESNVNVLKLKAHCLLLSSRIEEAIDALQQGILVFHDDGQLYLTLADCYMDQGEYDKMSGTIADYEKVFGETIDSLVKKAYVYLFKQDLQSSKGLIARGLGLDPDSIDMNRMAGDLYFSTEEFSKSEEFYEKVLLLTEYKNEEVLERLVLLNINKNDFLKAIDYQRQLLELSDNSAIRKKLALLYLEKGDKNEFLSYVNTFNEQDLVSFLEMFYPDDQVDKYSIDKDYILKKIDSIYESRLMYKNIKF